MSLLAQLFPQPAKPLQKSRGFLFKGSPRPAAQLINNPDFRVASHWPIQGRGLRERSLTGCRRRSSAPQARPAGRGTTGLNQRSDSRVQRRACGGRKVVKVVAASPPPRPPPGDKGGRVFAPREAANPPHSPWKKLP